ncbi:MAG: hypothetical protein M0011_10615 [Elusimicrobia bacterium]|nr:hypothetical protein [Elusimicrobiota bacterium]
MKLLCGAALALALAGPAAASFDEWEPEASQQADEAQAGEEDGAQPLLQESGEDLADFVTDYIRKDIQLKGAFFIEDKAAKKVLKLSLLAVGTETSDGENGSRAVTARFKDAGGAEFSVLFWLRDAPWGGLDIFRLELKASKPAPAAGKGKR